MGNVINFGLKIDERCNEIEFVVLGNFANLVLYCYKKKDGYDFVTDSRLTIKTFIELLNKLDIKHDKYKICNNIGKDNKQKIQYFIDKYYSIKLNEKACNSLIFFHKMIGGESYE